MTGKRTIILIAIIVVAAILGFAAPSDNINEADVADQIAGGAQLVIDAANDATASIKEAEREAKLEADGEHLSELGYPDEYDPNNPVANGEFTEEDWDAIQQEEAMNSLAEDAMREEAMQDEFYNRDPLFD